MLDAIVGFLFKTAGQFLLEAFLECVFYWPGWLFLRILTFGSYPPRPGQSHNRYLVSGIPLVVGLIIVTFAYS